MIGEELIEALPSGFMGGRLRSLLYICTLNWGAPTFFEDVLFVGFMGERGVGGLEAAWSL